MRNSWRNPTGILQESQSNDPIPGTILGIPQDLHPVGLTRTDRDSIEKYNCVAQPSPQPPTHSPSIPTHQPSIPTTTTTTTTNDAHHHHHAHHSLVWHQNVQQDQREVDRATTTPANVPRHKATTSAWSRNNTRQPRRTTREATRRGKKRERKVNGAQPGK